MLLRVEIVIRIYCENSTKITDTVCGQTAELLKLQQVVSGSILGHWGFFPGHQTVPCALGSTQPLK